MGLWMAAQYADTAASMLDIWVISKLGCSGVSCLPACTIHELKY